MTRDEIINLLQELLQREFLQRDLYETYNFYLSGLESPAIFEHFKVHQQEEQLHIELLQRYLMGYGAPPMVQRAPIPVIEPVGLNSLLKFNFELEKDAVKTYSETIEMLDGYSAYTSLKIDLEDILKQEQEHTHDLIQWLGLWKSPD